MKRENIDPKFIKVEHSVKAIGHLLHSFEADYGRDELVKFINKTGIPIKYFDNENNWVSYEYLCSILDQLVEYANDPNITYKYGLNTVKYADSWGILKTIFTLIPAPMYMYKSVVKFTTRFSKVGNSKITELKKNKVLIEFGFKDGYKQSINNCLNIKGSFVSLPTFFGLPYAEIKELQCAAKGADSCIYDITWQEKSDKKNNFFSLLISVLGVYIIYILIHWFDTSNIFLSKILLFVLPVALYAIGHALDFKRTIKDNTEVVDEQNKAMIESLENVQGLNEELQLKIDRRTEELKISNKKLEESLLQLKKSEEDLLAAEKMAGIGRLAAGVAHEINNPMGAVRNFLQDILEDITESDSRREALIEAEKATKESKIIINDLLSFSRTHENLYIVEIDVNEVLERICERIKFSNFNIKINKYLTPGISAIKSDQMQVNQALNNIILNACNASKENGIISIKTSGTPEGIHVEITDNGEIIPQFLIDKLFDPFDKEYKWVGRKDLGLAISYSIIKRFNGEITVSSSIENGTIFNVLIPYVIKV
jgi:signal transduction histidine kinase